MRHFATIAVLFLAAPAAHAEDLVVRGTELPREFTWEAPADGYLWLNVNEDAKGFTPFLEVLEPKGAKVNGARLQARVPKGPVKMKLSDRWQQKPDVEIRVSVAFRAETDAQEPNDDEKSARPVAPATKVSLAIMPQEEFDWFAIEVPAPGYLRAVWDNPPKGYTPWCRFLREDGVDQGQLLARVEPGKVFACVADKWHAYASADPMTVRFEFTPEMDAMEPNDTPAYATQIDAGAPYEAWLLPEGDVDWVKLTAPGPGYFVADVPADQGSDLVFRFRQGADGSDRDAKVFATPGGDVYAGLLLRWGGHRDTPLRFQIRFVPEFDELETGSGPAKRAETGRWYETGLITPDDVDSCVVDIPSRGVLYMDLRGAISDQVHWTIARDGAAPQPFDGTEDLQPGKVTVSWRNSYGNWSEAPFSVRFNFRPDTDKDDPGDTATGARPMELGKSTHVALYTREDQDWFRLEIPRDGILSLGFSGWSTDYRGDFDGRFEACDEKGNPYPAVQVDGKDLFGVYRVPKGAVLLRARSSAFYVEVDVLPELATGEPVNLGALHPSGVVFGFIGVDTDAGTNAGLEILARKGGGVFRKPEGSDAIAKEIRSIVVATKEAPLAPPVAPATAVPARGSRAWIWFLAGGLGLLLLIAVVALRLARGGLRGRNSSGP